MNLVTTGFQSCYSDTRLPNRFSSSRFHVFRPFYRRPQFLFAFNKTIQFRTFDLGDQLSVPTMFWDLKPFLRNTNIGNLCVYSLKGEYQFKEIIFKENLTFMI